MARFERIAEKTKEAVSQLSLLLRACRRVGRPIHVFRGLPTLERAFFHYDAMPRMLVELIGGDSLRLEQIPEAVRQLELAQTLLETNGLGYDMLRLYAAPASRFGATCLAWCHLRDQRDDRATLSTIQQGAHSHFPGWCEREELERRHRSPNRQYLLLNLQVQ